MRDLLKKIVSLLCMLALLLVVSVPAYAGGEHPWDSDNQPGQSGASTTPPDDSGTVTDPNAAQPTTGVYVGPGGIITGLGDWLYFYMLNVLDVGNAKSASAAVRSGTTTQSKGF
ncbi:MAG TPA: hypothetical protein VLB27_11860 [candidate division Zixibacteria bacterium]|nr:hypothetical protein [candidate division Zixibacteria bacterium]